MSSAHKSCPELSKLSTFCMGALVWLITAHSRRGSARPAVSKVSASYRSGTRRSLVVRRTTCVDDPDLGRFLRGPDPVGCDETELPIQIASSNVLRSCRNTRLIKSTLCFWGNETRNSNYTVLK